MMMARIQVGVIRHASVANAIGKALGVEPAPDIRIGRGRITITFRRLGATRWAETQQADYALKVADIARNVLSTDSRRGLRKRATTRAIVVTYEDATLVRGCSVVARWECVVPTG